MSTGNVGAWALSVVCFLAFCLLILLIEKWIDGRYPMEDEHERR